MEVDWDLHAVVRGCTTASSSATTTSSSSAVFTTTTSGGSSIKSEFSPQSCLSSFPGEQVGQLFSLADPFEARISGNIGGGGGGGGGGGATSNYGMKIPVNLHVLGETKLSVNLCLPSATNA